MSTAADEEPGYLIVQLTLRDTEATVLAEALDCLFSARPARRGAIADLLAGNRALLQAVARADNAYLKITRAVPDRP